MFDIQEYYNTPNSDTETKIVTTPHNIDDLIRDEINYFDRTDKHTKYEKDLFRNESHQIEVFYPKTSYDQNTKYLLTGNGIRSLLSMYPLKEKLQNISNIIIKPKYIKKDNIELTAMFIRKTGTLILYLTPTYYYEIENSENQIQNKKISTSIEKYSFGNRIVNFANLEEKNPTIHPLWHILSTIEKSDKEHIDKFFLRNNKTSTKENKLLNQISNYYEDRGY